VSEAFPQNMQYLNLASNFFVGDVPARYSIVFDYRFNYFDNCSDLCCLNGYECNVDCNPPSLLQDFTLPLGIESSTWTELDISLLGTHHRIIQIETQFTETPHILKSFACPLTDNVILCQSNNLQNISSSNIPSGSIVLEKNTSFFHVQSGNSYQNYVYFVDGIGCTTSIKVSLIISFNCNFLCPKTNRLQCLHL
jgi:hypothetical protein